MWIRVDVGVARSRKVARLAESLSIERAHAVGLAACLWAWVAEQAPNGDLGDITAEELAEACGWRGVAVELAAAMVEVGLLDEDDDGTRVHDWATHQPPASGAERMRRHRASADVTHAPSRRDARSVTRVTHGPSQRASHDVVKSDGHDTTRHDTNDTYVAPTSDGGRSDLVTTTRIASLARDEPQARTLDVAAVSGLLSQAGWPAMIPPKVVAQLRALVPIAPDELAYAVAQAKAKGASRHAYVAACIAGLRADDAMRDPRAAGMAREVLAVRAKARADAEVQAWVDEPASGA